MASDLEVAKRMRFSEILEAHDILNWKDKKSNFERQKAELESNSKRR